ncbi:hypothetical protein V7654_21895 [Bacillus sp. JJ1609]|uniref:hypothetical protein n=1 Tax=Bacillus sp. JJ1609 TaxID=3122977 RepID=UPI002FFEA8B9
MKKFRFTLILLLLVITIIGFYVLDSNKEVPMELVALESLTNKEKLLVPASPKDSIIKKVEVNKDIKTKLNKKYDKDEIYQIMFRNTQTDSSGNLVVYIALDKKTVVGKGFDW